MICQTCQDTGHPVLRNGDTLHVTTEWVWLPDGEVIGGGKIGCPDCDKSVAETPWVHSVTIERAFLTGEDHDG